MPGIVRMLYQFRESRLLDRKLVARAERALLSFKYWPDEPGIDSMCTWTENHQIMFAANEYLAGQLFPERAFEGRRREWTRNDELNSEVSGPGHR